MSAATWLLVFIGLTACARIDANRASTEALAYALKNEGLVGEVPQCSGEVCNVVVVVDMQNDYCSTCEEVLEDAELQKTQSPWAGPAIKEIAPNVQAVLGMRQWDMVVLTRDVLFDREYLKVGTPGTNTVKEITDHVDMSKAVLFSKDVDDWFNSLDGERSFDGKRHFALENEGAYVGDESRHPTLRQLLKHNGYAPGKTNLVVTGVLTNRCVLKGSVHARMAGYSVFVVKDATGGQSDADRWNKVENDAPQLQEDLTDGGTESVEKQKAVLEQHTYKRWAALGLAAKTVSTSLRNWERRIFHGYKGGPALEDTWGFMKKADVKVVETAADFQPGSNFDLDVKPQDLNHPSACHFHMGKWVCPG